MEYIGDFPWSKVRILPDPRYQSGIEVSWQNDRDFAYRLFHSTTDNLARWQSRKRAAEICGEVQIKNAERIVHQYTHAHIRFALLGQKSPAYRTLNAKLTNLKYWRTDLTHIDAETLLWHGKARFVWGVRETGTSLFYNPQSVDWSRESVKVFDNTWYMWNGMSLYQIDKSQVEGIVRSL